MKRILAFGDSNTWGSVPGSGERFGRDTRWSALLAKQLGETCEVIEEGLCGRTTIWDDPLGPHTNGRNYLIPCLASHAPLDLVMLMLGTNDLKARFSLPAADIAEGISVLARIVLAGDAGINGRPPKLLLMAPPPLGELGDNAEKFAGAGAKSRRFSVLYREVAGELGCAFFDAGEVIRSSDTDGIHLEAGEHVKLANALAPTVKSLISD